MIVRQGILILLFATLVSSFSWPWESEVDTDTRTIEKRDHRPECKNHMDCYKCDEIKRKGQCHSYLSVCAKTCHPECASTPFADDPYKPCAEIKAKGDCRKQMPYSSATWATVCEKSCCCLDTPPHWGPWSHWGSCSKSCDFGYKTRTRECQGEGFGQTCEGSPFESVKCNADVPCKGLVGWEKTAVTVNEDVGTVTLKIIRSRKTDCKASIKVNTNDGTAQQPGDYAKIENLVINFEKGETEKSVTFTINKDRMIEGLESFTAVISANPHKLDVDPATTTISIKDCTAKIGLRKEKCKVHENLKIVKLIVYREGCLRATNKICLFTIDGTARAASDFVAISKQEVVFAPDDTHKDVSITIVDDGVEEQEEDFFVVLRCADPATLIVEPGKAIVVIKDDDVDGNWSDWSPYGMCSKSCGSGVQTRSKTCTNPKPQGGGKSCAGDATSSQTCNNNPCPIDGSYGEYGPFGECSKTCGGGVKFRTRECNSPAPQYGGKPCEGPSKDSRACNNQECPIDGGYGEYGPYGECSKTCGGGVKFRTRECNSPAPQYGGKPCEGPSKDSRACNNQECPIDGGYSEYGPYGECSQTCGGGVQFRTRECNSPAPQYGGKPCDGPNKESRTCNTHRCPVKVGLRQTEKTVLENIGKFQIPIIRSESTIGTNRVLVSIVPGSASPSSDYIDIPLTEVIFNPGETTKLVTITIIDDKILEKPEVFFVKLRSNDDSITEVNPAIAKITIIDDDVQIGFKETSYSVRESDGSVTLKIFRIGYLKNTNTAILKTCDQTAVAPGDYTALKDAVVNFAPTETVNEIRVKIVDDEILENIETFSAKLSTKDPRVSVISPAKAVISIVDNDVKVGFRPATYEVIESRPFVIIQMYRIGNINGPTKVILNTIDRTAQANQDYQPLTNFPVIFAAGQTTKSIKVLIINNNINRVLEQLESFNIEMTSNDRDVTMIMPNIANVKIIDDDAIIGFQMTKYRVKETSGFLKVVIRRSGATRFQHTAILLSRDGTASAPGDYQRIRPTLITFAANELEKVALLKINDDNQEEGLESLALILTTRDPRVLISPRAASVDIIDNDVNGRWLAWSPWSTCGKTCGLSSQSRTRGCIPPQGGGRPCFGPAKQTRQCFIRQFCPVDGGFSNWSPWSTCTRSCGGGISTRTRSCTNPVPRFGGAPCSGATKQVITCNKQCCPVDGMWGSWGAWSSCSVSCQGQGYRYGFRVRRRKCNSPAVSCNGRFCFGGSAAARQVRRCFSSIPCPGAGSEIGVESHSIKPTHSHGGESQQATQAPNPYGGESQPAPQQPNPYGGESQPSPQQPNPYGGESQPAPQQPNPYGGESQPAPQQPNGAAYDESVEDQNGRN